MKPLKLTIEGLKSIAAAQTIDFQKVTKGGIFGIFGNTGSGKSTILDAIVLSLYGEVIENINNSQFINLNCMKSAVDFTFAIYNNGGYKTYRVERVFKFNKERTRVATSLATLWELNDGALITLAEGSQRVNDCIRNDIVGLEKGDFLKCIALPQGEFSAFVKATRGERLAVIGKLFDIEKYGEKLVARVKGEYEGINAQKLKLEGEKAGLGYKSNEELNVIKGQVEELAQELEKATAELRQAESVYKSAAEYEKLLEDRTQKERERKNMLADRSIIDGYRQKLGILGMLKNIQSDIARYKNLLKQKSEQEKRLSSLSGKLVELKGKFEQAKTAYENISEFDKTRERLLERKGNLLSLESKIRRLESLNDELVELRNNYKSDVESLKNNRMLYSQLEEEIKEIEAERIALDAAGAIEKIKRLSESKGILQCIEEEIAFLDGFSKKYLSKMDNGEACSDVSARMRGLQSVRESLLSEAGGDLARAVLDATKPIGEDSRLSAVISQNTSKLSAIKTKTEQLKEKLEQLNETGGKKRAESDALNKEAQLILNGENYHKALENINSEIVKNDKKKDAVIADYRLIDGDLKSISEQISLVQLDIEQRDKEIGEILCIIDQTAEKCSLDRDTILQQKFDEKTISDISKAIENYDKNFNMLEGAICEINIKLGAYEVKPDIAESKSCLDNARSHQEEVNKKYIEISSDYQKDLKKVEQWCIIDRKLLDINKRADLLSKLISLTERKKFLEYIADEYLAEIAHEAEIRVLELTMGKYGLVYEGDFYVTDNMCGGKKRSVAGLSGGETFLVSLSLALALASQISRKALKPIDFFFLDEGFGTLDGDLVDAVLSSLEKLRQSDFTVGLISHVAELKNRIQNKINVTGADASHGTLISISC